MNIVGYILLIGTCLFVASVEASGRVYKDSDVIGYTEDRKRITFGEHIEYLQKNIPNLIKYCNGKAHTAMGIFNERETKSPEDMMEELQPIQERFGRAEYIDFKRMVNDITRKNKRTGEWRLPFSKENVLHYANAEMDDCTLNGF